MFSTSAMICYHSRLTPPPRNRRPSCHPPWQIQQVSMKLGSGNEVYPRQNDRATRGLERIRQYELIEVTVRAARSAGAKLIPP
jgi:GTP cyclohydrolase II